MRKFIKVEKETQVIFCDCCAKELGTYIRNCDICSKDLCSNCIIYDRDYTDNPPKYCTKCWNIGIPYRLKIGTLTYNFDKEIEEIRSKWIKDCLEFK